MDVAQLNKTDKRPRIVAQSGPQEMFLSSRADICIFGGSAGGGKTYALLLECLRHIQNSEFGAVIFRRTSKQVRSEGGLWDRSMEIFPPYASPRETYLQWVFRSGCRVTFAHMEHDKDRFNWDGSQIPYIGFDELIHFSKSQFFYMLSRNRSTCGVPPYIRATTNPDANSWVAEFIEWWIDQNTGYPILERSGVLRWFYMVDNSIYWYDSRSQAMAMQPELAKEAKPKSVTFIPSRLEDNPALEQKDPNYRSNLLALPMVERERLLKGNWKIQAEGGNVFNRSWWVIVPDVPKEKLIRVRFWDKAATDSAAGAETAGVLMAKTETNIYYIENVVHGKWSTWEREQLILQTANIDGRDVEIVLEQEPGSGGKDSAAFTIRNLSGFKVTAERATGDKVVRAGPFASQVEAGNVYLVEGDWNRAYIEQHHNFPNTKLKDMVDASSGAFNYLSAKIIMGKWQSVFGKSKMHDPAEVNKNLGWK